VFLAELVKGQKGIHWLAQYFLYNIAKNLQDNIHLVVDVFALHFLQPNL